MKKMILVLVMSLAIGKLSAQFTEERMLQLEKKVDQQDKYIQNMNDNIHGHAAEFKTGTTVMFVGMLVSSAFGIMMASGNIEVKQATPLVAVGGGLALIGWVIQLHSHHWFKYGKLTNDEWIEQSINQTKTHRGE